MWCSHRTSPGGGWHVNWVRKRPCWVSLAPWVVSARPYFSALLASLTQIPFSSLRKTRLKHALGSLAAGLAARNSGAFCLTPGAPPRRPGRVEFRVAGSCPPCQTLSVKPSTLTTELLKWENESMEVLPCLNSRDGLGERVRVSRFPFRLPVSPVTDHLKTQGDMKITLEGLE